MSFSHTIGSTSYAFADLRELLAKATPLRSGDVLAGLAAASAEERVAAQLALADLPLAHFLDEQVIPYETDEVTRLIVDSHNAQAFAPIRSLTVGQLRNWLLSDDATPERLAALAPGLTPEMAAAVSKLMRVQDLIATAAKIRVAIGDEIGAVLCAQLSVVLIGERPGLSSPDSLGAYITWQPRPGRTDAERHCISNIRPEGLSYAQAAAQLDSTLIGARRRQLTGVAPREESHLLKKDESA